MIDYNFKQFIGKKLMGFKSGFCRLLMYDNIIETHLDYKSIAIFSEDEMKAPLQAYLIESSWEEIENGGDDFKIAVDMYGESYKLSSLGGKHVNYPSSLDISEFIVSSIDIYGYDVNFNLTNPTKHIVYMKSNNGQELLIKPDGCGIGLLVSHCAELNKIVLEESPQKEYIYHVANYV